MKIPHLSNNKYVVSCVSTIYIFFLIVGFFIYKDFGLSIDEIDQRWHGFIYLKYLFEIFYPAGVTQINEIIQTPTVSDPSVKLVDEYYGPIFNVMAAYIEYFFKVDDSRDYYLFRHYLNYSVFIISNFYFFLIARERFNSNYWGILGALFLFLSPRIFAHSFFNHKDLVFMSFFIINLYYGLIFLKSPNYKNSIFFAISTALSVDTRIMGIFFPIIIILFSYLKYLRNVKIKIMPGLLVFIILTPLLIIMFWPYLWENPLINFIAAFKSFSSIPWDWFNLYIGKYISSTNLPWHYIFVWIGITTPIFYLFLFIIGFANYSLRLKSRLFKITNNESLNDLWRGEKELQDLVFYTSLILPIFAVILLNSRLYDGWRHMFFIYPCLLMISLKGLYLLKLKYFKKNQNIFVLIVGIFLAHISFVMIKNHPHQNVYFNFLAGKNIEKKFELDYWGLSNKQAYEYILKNDSDDKILIGTASSNHLRNSKKILTIDERKRISISENNDAKYIIDNYRHWHGISKKQFHISEDFKIYKEIFVGKQKIISIYKRI